MKIVKKTLIFSKFYLLSSKRNKSKEGGDTNLRKDVTDPPMGILDNLIVRFYGGFC